MVTSLAPILQLLEDSTSCIVIHNAHPDLIADLLLKGASVKKSTDLQSIGSEYVYRLQHKDIEIIIWSKHHYTKADIQKAAYIGVKFSDWLKR